MHTKHIAISAIRRVRAFSSPPTLVNESRGKLVVGVPDILFSTPIKKQNMARVMLRGEDDILDRVKGMLERTQWQVGKVVEGGGKHFQRGVGSGVLIGDRYLLTSRHVIGEDARYRVVFGAVGGYHSKGMAFEVSGIIEPDSHQARVLGLQCGHAGDFVILKVDAKDGEYPGNKYGYTPLSVPLEDRPTLYFQGFQSGSNLKVSTASHRPKRVPYLLATRFVEWVGKKISWNRTTSGVIQSTTKDNEALTLLLHSPTQKPVLRVDGEGQVTKNGRQLQSDTDYQVLLPPQYGVDHVIVAHQTGGGSSGGVYFTEKGEIYAIHIGTIDRLGGTENIAYFPWASTVTTIYDDIVTLEGRNDKGRSNQKAVKPPPKNKKAPLPPKGSFSSGARDCQLTTAIQTGCINIYLPVRISGILGKDCGEGSFSLSATKCEGVIKKALEEMNLKGEKNLRVDFQSPHTHTIPSYTDAVEFNCIQVQYGTGSDGKSGGSYAGVLAQTNQEFTLKDYQGALENSFRDKVYWVIYKDQNSNEIMIKSSTDTLFSSIPSSILKVRNR
jgi:hypothetical protein